MLEKDIEIINEWAMSYFENLVSFPGNPEDMLRQHRNRNAEIRNRFGFIKKMEKTSYPEGAVIYARLLLDFLDRVEMLRRKRAIMPDSLLDLIETLNFVKDGKDGKDRERGRKEWNLIPVQLAMATARATAEQADVVMDRSQRRRNPPLVMMLLEIMTSVIELPVPFYGETLGFNAEAIMALQGLNAEFPAPSRYEWGEKKTPYFDFAISFYDMYPNSAERERHEGWDGEGKDFRENQHIHESIYELNNGNGSSRFHDLLHSKGHQRLDEAVSSFLYSLERLESQSGRQFNALVHEESRKWEVRKAIGQAKSSADGFLITWPLFAARERIWESIQKSLMEIGVTPMTSERGVISDLVLWMGACLMLPDALWQIIGVLKDDHCVILRNDTRKRNKDVVQRITVLETQWSHLSGMPSKGMPSCAQATGAWIMAYGTEQIPQDHYMPKSFAVSPSVPLTLTSPHDSMKKYEKLLKAKLQEQERKERYERYEEEILEKKRLREEGLKATSTPVNTSKSPEQNVEDMEKDVFDGFMED